MSTKLAFQTPPEGVTIPAGEAQGLGVIDVHGFSRIRVVAQERPNSVAEVLIFLVMVEKDHKVALLDMFTLTPQVDNLRVLLGVQAGQLHAALPIPVPNPAVTRVYDVPGTTMEILVKTVGGEGTDTVDLLVYGSE